MGMFNYVDYEIPCKVCHAKVSGFQTKDDSKAQLALYTVTPSSVDNFYAPCDKCGCWVEVNKVILPTDEYLIEFQGKDDEVLEHKMVKFK